MKVLNYIMIKSIRIAAVFTLAWMVCSPSFAQYVLKKADNQFRLYNFYLAKSYYEEAYRKKPGIRAARGAAESHRMMNNYAFAESWYAKVVAMPQATNQDYITYSKVLIGNYKYNEARKFLSDKRQNFRYDSVATAASRKLITDCDSSLAWLRLPVNAHWENISAVNTAQSDWGSVLHNNKLFFVSDRPDATRKHPHRPFFAANNNLFAPNYGWTGNAYLELYSADNKGQSTPIPFPLPDAVIYHTGPACFSADGKEIFFARTRFVKKRMTHNAHRVSTIHIELYSSEWNEQSHSWNTPKPFPYNNVMEYSVGDPFLSADGKTLYFTSDMPGTRGGMDIFFCRRDKDGNWNAPENMGTDINTSGNERTPFLTSDDVLLFASDGHIGMGGLDLFKAAWNVDHWNVVNMHPPINSPQDDFAGYFTDAANGYISSDRFGGVGEDDIYTVRIDQPELPHEQRTELIVSVKDKDNDQPLSNAVIALYENGDGTRLSRTTGPDGVADFLIKNDLQKVKVAIAIPGFITQVKELILSDLQVKEENDLKIYMTGDIELIPVAVGKPITLENVYYDRNKWNLREDAISGVEKLLKILQDNPTYKVEISSHTDSRADDTYNMRLSQRRAQSVVDYLIANGIDKNRLIAKGYGETRLVNRCANGVPCTEEEHQQNRRTEFTVLEQ